MSKKHAKFTYHELYRDRLDPILDAAWEVEKEKMKYTNDDARLLFRNSMLKEMLSTETDEIKAHIDEFREREVRTRLVKEEAQDGVEFLKDGEHNMPADEKARLIVVRKRTA